MEPIEVVMLASSHRGNPNTTASIFHEHLCVFLIEEGIIVHEIALASNTVYEPFQHSIHMHRFSTYPLLW